MHTWTLGVGCAQVCISLRASCRMDEWVRAPGARALGSLQGVCRLQACTQSCTGISMYIHTCICSLAAIQIKGTAMRIINPRRACAARVTVLGLCVCLSVCLFVCLSVDDYSRTTGYEAAYERYQQLQCYKGMKNNVAILLKRLRSRDMA